MANNYAELLRIAICKTLADNDRNGTYADSDCDAEGIPRLVIGDACLAYFVETAKEEIAGDINSGLIPNTVRGFAELHDYVDANEYGLLCELWGNMAGIPSDDRVGVLCGFSNRVQSALDEWLRNGAAAEFGPRTIA